MLKIIEMILNFLSKIKCKCKSGCGGELDYNPSITSKDVKENIKKLKSSNSI